MRCPLAGSPHISIRPAHENCTSGVAGAYGDQQDEVAFAEAFLFYGVHHAEGDGACGGVSEAVDIDQNF
jgi:hypothetical protein